MVDYKEILRLSQQYYSLRQIAASVCHSHHTVKNVLDLAAQHGIEWPLDDDITNAELEKLFHPDKKVQGYPMQSSTTSTSTANCPRRVSRSRCSGRSTVKPPTQTVKSHT